MCTVTQKQQLKYLLLHRYQLKYRSIGISNWLCIPGEKQCTGNWCRHPLFYRSLIGIYHFSHQIPFFYLHAYLSNTMKKSGSFRSNGNEICILKHPGYKTSCGLILYDSLLYKKRSMAFTAWFALFTSNLLVDVVYILKAFVSHIYNPLFYPLYFILKYFSYLFRSPEQILKNSLLVYSMSNIMPTIC